MIFEDGSSSWLWSAGDFFEETDLPRRGESRTIRSRVNCVIYCLDKSDLESLEHSIPALTPLRELARQSVPETWIR